MKVVYSPDHLLHNPEYEIYDGKMEPYAETAARIETIRDALAEAGYKIVAPRDFSLALIDDVHFSYYSRYLQAQSEALDRGEPGGVQPQRHLSNFIMDLYTPVTNGTYQAARTAANVALTAMQEVQAGSEAYGLCRPPGHHAEPDRMGGYCYFNNAAIVAAELAEDHRVAILDVDFHHGNGTQEIFYDRDDVLYVSLHADPSDNFPYFAGREEEIGRGSGKGFNVNIPLPKDTDITAYLRHLHGAQEQIHDFAPEHVVLSLGFDTYKNDPIAGFDLDIPDYQQLGRAIGSIEVPITLIQEGGYCVPDLGKLALSFLSGYERAR